MKNTFTFSSNLLINPSRSTAIIILICGVCIIAFMPILARLSESEIDPIATMFHRVWIATLLLAIWQGVRQFSANPSKGDPDRDQLIQTRKIGGLLLLGSLFFVIQQVIWAWSIAETSIANSALLHNFTPFFTTLGAWLVFGQYFDRQFCIGTIVAIAGGIAIGLNDFSYGIEKIQGDLLAFLSAFFYAGYLLLAERVRSQVNTTTALLYFCSIGSLCFLPMLPWMEGDLLPSSGQGWLIVMGLALTIAIGHGLTIYSLKRLSSGLVSVIMLLNPLLNGIWGWIVFAESLDLYNLLAFPVILLGIYLAITSQSALKDKS